MSGYSIGREVEYAVIANLRECGYEIQRAASSKGIADVLAIKQWQVLMVSVKKTKMPGPDERLYLWRVAGLLPNVAVPLVALKPVRQPLEYRLLTGVGPRDWEPWSPDFGEAA